VLANFEGPRFNVEQIKMRRYVVVPSAIEMGWNGDQKGESVALLSSLCCRVHCQ
jgi:hypothetical protein